MSTTESKRQWEQRLHEVGTQVEQDLRSLIKYINDEVVPDVRRNGSEALRAAAAELQKLAQRVDDQARRNSSPPPKDTTKP